jgi:acid phosphatase family membrane protein YuiD
MKVFLEYPLLVPIIAGTLAEIAKLTHIFYKKHFLEAGDFFQTGGMPSGHTIFVVSLATTVGIIDGLQSTTFAIALSFAIVVMYDALKLRRAVGNHATELNRLRGDNKFHEGVGHTPLEVFAGIVAGSVSTFFLLSVF